MPAFDVTTPDGAVYRIDTPEGATEKDAIAYAQNMFAGKQRPKKEEFVPLPIPQGSSSGAGFSTKDTGIALGQGIVGAGKSIADAFGADNAVSNYLGNISGQLGQAYTPERRAEMQRREQLQKEASASGSIVKEIQAFLGGVAEAPVQALAQGLGSIVPYAGTGIIGAIGKLGGATVRAINTVVGTAQGAGAVKGSIYDNVRDELISNGMSEKEAKAKASKAQEYLGSNFLDIVGGAALGGAGARFGVENLLTPGISNKLNASLLPRVGKAMLAEAPLEGLQGGQEQLAVNRALIDQGFRKEVLEGVFGSAARDAVIGAITAGTVGIKGPGKTPTTTPVEQPPEILTPEATTTIPGAIASIAPMLDEQGNLISSRQATSEEIEAAKTVVPPPVEIKPTAEQIKKDEEDALGTIDFKAPKEKKSKVSKFEALTPEAKKLLDLASIGAKPPVELTPKEIKQIAETNDISYLKDNKIPLSYDELIGELNAKAGAPNGPVDVEAGGASAEVLSERGTIPTEGSGEPDRSGVADARSDVIPVDGGTGDEQPTLVIPAAGETPQEVTEEISKPAPFLGINPSAGTTRTEEDLYPKAIGRRGELEKLAAEETAAEPTIEEKIKLKEEIENVKKAAGDLLAGTEDAKKFYNSLPKNTQDKVDDLLNKLKNLKKPEVVKPKKAGEKPVGITYPNVTAYKKQVAAEKKEAKAAAKEEPAPRKLSLLEERLADFRKTKSFGVPLEALNNLRGGTTVGMMADLMNGDLRGALQEIVNDKTNEFTALDKIVAKRLLAAKTLPKIQVVPESQIGGSNGRYDAATDMAYIGENSMTSHTVLHEALHGFTLAIIKAHKDKSINNPGVRNLDELYEHLKANYPDLKGKYGMENLAEFVSEVMSNSDFQEQLNAIEYKRSNVFTEFARVILQMLGISPTDNFTALAYALVSTESILTEGRKLEETNPPPATANLDVTGLKQETEPKKQHSKVEYDEYLDNIKANTKAKLGTPTPEKIKQALTTKEGGQDLVRKFQNRRSILRRIYISLERQGLLKTTGEDINNVAAQFDTAAAIADNRDRSSNRKVRDETIELIGTYAKAAKINEQDALANLQLYFETQHEPERRAVKYALTVPLSNEKTLSYLGQTVSPADRRRQITDFLNNYKETDQTKRHKIVKDLRKELDSIISNKANLDTTKGILLDINDAKYNVIAGLSPEKIASFKAELMAKPEVKNHLATFEAISKNLKTMNDNNKVLNAEGNFWTTPVDNWAEFYGFQNYVPFKGKPDTEIEEANYDPSKKMLVGLQEGVNAMEGRESQADNPIIQIMIDTVNAARRAGYKDVTLSIKNAVKQGYLSGVVNEGEKGIPFDANRTENIKKQRGQNNIFHYEPNGDITVIELTNREQREAIRNTFKEDHPFISMLESITGTIAHFHTRYNPSFAPVNFVGDLMTNIFTMGAEFGPTTSGQLLKNIAAVVGSGGLHKAGIAAVEYEKNGTKNLRKYIDKNSKDYDPFYADLVEYLERGGKVSYMQAFDTESNTAKTIKTIKRGGKETTKEQVDAVIDVWGSAFEFASRTASYRTAKEIYLKENRARNIPEAEAQEDAKQRATYYSKNLANFEQVGEYGKVFGAFYMFARPAATGAVRAIEALAPMIRVVFGGERFDTSTPEGAALAKQAKSGAIMTIMLLGLGIASYTMAGMLSDDDEEGRNRTATDDMDRWQKYMRFHIPKDLVGGRDDVILQMRWGYGLGSFASAGAQLAALAAGNSSFKTAGANILQSGLDSFLPLPISRINPFDHTAAWFLDTATPSAFRPFLEYTMNLDGLGREIYNNRQSLIGDAYTGGDNIPEMYKDAARMLHSVTDGGIDISPNTMYFFANNGADGLARVMSGTYNLGLVAAGEKAFNPKTDTIPFDGFFGSKSNFDARKFSEVEKQVAEVKKRVKTLEADPEKYVSFLNKNPNAAAAIEFYDKAVNGDLRDLRAEANRIRSDRSLNAKERKILLDNITQMSNLVKRNMTLNLETLGYTP
jgi:hypothetical protein